MTHEDVASRAFLPGGVWFYFACLGAGTPSSSAYAPWLETLKELGRFRGSIADVQASLPAAGAPPFVARLPQAALANPDGPLGVFGHVDLAWTYSFQDYSDKGTRNRPSRFQDVLRALVDGKRFGNGFHDIYDALNQASTDLSMIYGQEDRARRKGLPVDEDKAGKMKKANLWMRQKDLSAYVLLGDPAAHLGIRRPQAQAAAPTTQVPEIGSTPQALPEAAEAEDVERIEEAVIAWIKGDESKSAIAARYGMTKSRLDQLGRAYQDAGRAAVARLSRA
jgi:hypothetical protein